MSRVIIALLILVFFFVFLLLIWIIFLAVDLLLFTRKAKSKKIFVNPATPPLNLRGGREGLLRD